MEDFYHISPHSFPTIPHSPSTAYFLPTRSYTQLSKKTIFRRTLRANTRYPKTQRSNKEMDHSQDQRGETPLGSPLRRESSSSLSSVPSSEEDTSIRCTWPGCTLPFLTERGKNIHIARYHEIARYVQCMHCEHPGFKSNNGLKYHMETKHSVECLVANSEGCGWLGENILSRNLHMEYEHAQPRGDQEVPEPDNNAQASVQNLGGDGEEQELADDPQPVVSPSQVGSGQVPNAGGPSVSEAYEGMMSRGGGSPHS